MVATLVFLALAVVGMLVLVLAAALGHDVDHELDVGADISEGMPGAFTLKTFAVFLTAFGAVGALSSHFLRDRPQATLVSAALGVASGIVLAGV